MQHQRLKPLSQRLPALCIQLCYTRQFHQRRSQALLRQPPMQHGGIVGQHGVHIHTGATRCRIGRGDEHHSSQLQAVMPQRIQRKQNMVQPTQIVAAHKQHGQAHRGHEVEHVLTLVERHPQASSALKKQHFSGAGAAVANHVVAQPCAGQASAFAGGGQMR